MRLRITFSKQGALRYTGHLDLHKIWERAARRAQLPLTYSQGFHPHPQIQLAAALPLGFSSRCELVDLKLNETLPLEGLVERIQGAVPSGLHILSVESVDERAPALQTQVASAEFEVELLEHPGLEELAQKLDSVLAADSLPRERRGKPYDLRPLIEQLALIPPPHLLSGEGPGARVFMRLAAREGATGRPEEVLDALGIPLETARVERTRLIFK
jgi:radical SAM-linked protein